MWFTNTTEHFSAPKDEVTLFALLMVLTSDNHGKWNKSVGGRSIECMWHESRKKCVWGMKRDNGKDRLKVESGWA